jgi:aspartyl-tRNA(Asn)/glutamyl-tRNA(Gln) amidotransferase subunit C
MKITRETAEHVARLAHLELEPTELERIERQLDSILAYIEKLNELDTANVEPMAQVLGRDEPEAAQRTDELKSGLPREEALLAAPDTDRVYVKVPKVIER